MMHQMYLILHLLAATIWVGCHLFLTLRILPEAIKRKDASLVTNFKDRFEPMGLPSLLILLVTGILMAYNYNISFTTWFSFSNAIESIVSMKLILLFASVAIAIYAQLFVFPKVTSTGLLPVSILIIAITLIGVTMLILGSLVSLGGF